MTFEELIKKTQKDSGLTQADFADSIQISRKTFLNWVKGKHLPLETDTVLQIISDVYNKPMPVLSKALQKSKEQRMLGDNTVDMSQISEDNIDSILHGDERTVVNTITKIFEEEYSDLSSEQRGYCRLLIKNSILVAKRLCGDDMTFKDLKEITWNGETGRINYVIPLKRKPTMPDGTPISNELQREHDELIDWFLQDYYQSKTNQIWKNTNAVRVFFELIVFNFNIKASNSQAIPALHKNNSLTGACVKNTEKSFSETKTQVQIDRPQIDMSLPFDEAM